jgi:hypothetical protein
MDSAKRSVTKAITWKTLGFIVLPFVALATFPKTDTGCMTVETESFLALSVAYHVLMFALFVAHERIWNKIKWGKKR